MKRIRHAVLLSIIVGMAVVGALYAFRDREALHTDRDSLLEDGETYISSSPSLYPDFSVGEVARVSKLSVAGIVGDGRFLKKNGAGDEVAKGAPHVPISLWYYAQFHVTEYLKGSGSDQITLALPAEPDGSSATVREESRLVQGSEYVLQLVSKDGYDEWYLGPNVYRVYEGSYGKWRVTGETAVSDDGRDVAMSLNELRGKIADSCSAEVRTEFAAAILANEYCP